MVYTPPSDKPWFTKDDIKGSYAVIGIYTWIMAMAGLSTPGKMFCFALPLVIGLTWPVSVPMYAFIEWRAIQRIR